MRIAFTLLLLSCAAGWGQNFIHPPCVTSITPPTCASSDAAVCTRLMEKFAQDLLTICAPVSEGKSDHPEFATCWNDKAMNLHCSDLTKSEAVDVPAINLTVIPWENLKSTNGAGSVCKMPPDGDLSNWVCIDGKSYDMRPKWGCKNPKRILERSEENPPRYWCRKPQP